MSKRQRVFFRIGAWASLATSLIHMAGQLGPRPPAANEDEATLLRLLSTYRRDMGGGIERTTLDFLTGFSVSFSLFLAWVGVLCLLLLRRHDADARFMRAVARVCAIFAAAVLAVSVVDFFWPPTICVAVIFVGFAGASVGRTS